MAKGRKQQPRRERSRSKPTVAERSDVPPAALLFHGGAPGLVPGDILRPAAALGFDFSYHTKGSIYDPNYVYLTRQLEVATAYAARCVMPMVDQVPGTVYQVQPLGLIEPDPDYGPVSEVYLRAPRARVLSVIRTDVVLTVRQQVELEAPWMVWGRLDRPMYDAEGYMIPSDEMRDNGVTPDHTRIYGPYLPWQRIDATGKYNPTDHAKLRGVEGYATELLEEVPDLDSAAHLVTLDGDFATEGRDVGYSCICGLRRDSGGVPPHHHQLGERLLQLLGAAHDDNGRRILPEVLARAAALRSPARWSWFLPWPVLLPNGKRAQV